MKNVHPEVFRLYNSINADDDDKRMINELLLWNKDIPEATKDILEKILAQASEVYESLVPLIDLGITFDIWLVGGSVRDLLLGNANLIKDLDIVISFDQPTKPHIPTPSEFKKATRFNFKLEQLQSLIYREEKDKKLKPFAHWAVLKSEVKSNDVRLNKKLAYEAALFDMIACGLGQKFELYEIYKPALSSVNVMATSEQYLDLKLSGVIKIRKDTWEWPIDILISHHNISDFLGAFDFGICKVAMELVSGFQVRQQRFEFPKAPADLLKRVRLTTHFLHDVKGKHLSMGVSSAMSMRQIKHSLEKHLAQIEKKYPWSVKATMEGFYEVDDFAPVGESVKNEVENYLKSFFLQRRLNKSLSKDELKIEIQSKKINKI